MTIVIPSSSTEIMANPARFLDDVRAGRVVYLTDLGGTSKSASMAIHPDYGIRGEYLVPPVAEQARPFIDRNREALLDYWECRIDTAELIERLKPV